MSGQVWAKKGVLPDIPIAPSANITRQEHGDPPPAPKPPTKPVEARKPDPVDDDQDLRPGSVRPPEGRKGSADRVDWRTLNATERWVQISTRITYDCNDKIRRIARARKRAGKGRTKLCEILEDMAELMGEREGIK